MLDEVTRKRRLRKQLEALEQVFFIFVVCSVYAFHSSFFKCN